MANPPPPIYLDEDVSVVVAAILRARGFEATTARDIRQLGRSDFGQLTFAAAIGCVLLTHNRVDFERLHQEWLQNGRPHKGIIIARRRPPAELAARVGQLLGRLPTGELSNQLLYI